MVLVPEDAVNRYEQRQTLETSPIMSNMMHKDTQMSNVLQRDGIGTGVTIKSKNCLMPNWNAI